MTEKIVLMVIGSNWFILAVASLLVPVLAKWWETLRGTKWERYEGWFITGIKAAEKFYPGGGKGVEKMRFAIGAFLAKYELETGKTPNDKAMVEIENYMAIIHAELEKNGQLGKKDNL